jgi:putative SOS response-associated peptidase YedK
MCGAFGFTDPGFPDSYLQRFEISRKSAPDVQQSYNIRPSQEALIVTRNSPNKGANNFPEVLKEIKPAVV